MCHLVWNTKGMRTGDEKSANPKTMFAVALSPVSIINKSILSFSDLMKRDASFSSSCLRHH